MQSTETYFQKLGVRENFRNLHLGMISEIKRKTLPEIAKVVGLENQQSIHHFLRESPWSVESLKKRRLELILRVLKEQCLGWARPTLILIIDETGDKKQGRATDYVKRQYIGNLGKIENGIVAVTAYGVIFSYLISIMNTLHNHLFLSLFSDFFSFSSAYSDKRKIKGWLVPRNN